MKYYMKSFISLCLVVLGYFTVGLAQSFEPKWVGQVNMLSVETDTVSIPLERANIQVKTTQSLGRLLVGIGNVRTKVAINGSKSPVQVNPDRPFHLVIKCKDNLTDPFNFIQVMKFEETKKERKTELAKENWVGNVYERNMKLLPFEADQYGASSYILKIEPQSGEFGVWVMNPSNIDESIPVLYCFGAHDSSRVPYADAAQIQEVESRLPDTYEIDGILYPVYVTKDGERYIMKSKNEKIVISE